jgi:hypothetical protein
MHSVCGQDHEPTAPCPPPAERTITYTEWGVLLDEKVTPMHGGEDQARYFAGRHNRPVVIRTVTAGPWQEAPPAEPAACEVCQRIVTHRADHHPLPPHHPEYDAFWDASDEQLAGMVADYDRQRGRRGEPA